MEPHVEGDSVVVEVESELVVVGPGVSMATSRQPPEESASSSEEEESDGEDFDEVESDFDEVESDSEEGADTVGSVPRPASPEEEEVRISIPEDFEEGIAEEGDGNTSEFDDGRESKKCKSTFPPRVGSQCCGLLIVSYTILLRRLPLYLVHLLIPLLCLASFYLSGALSTEYVKPVFDAAMAHDNPLADPGDWVDLPRLNFPMLQNAIPKALSIDSLDVVPTRLLYHVGVGVTNRTALLDYLALLPVYNVSYDDPEEGLRQKVGLVLEEVTEPDRVLYDSHIREEFTGDYNAYIGAVTFEYFDLGTDTLELSYTLERETGTLKRKEPSATLVASLLAVKNNYTQTTEFCRLAGVVSMTFECDAALTTPLLSLLNSLFIREVTDGIIVSGRVSQMPFVSLGFKSKVGARSGDVACLTLFPFCVVALLPLFVYELVREKESGARTQMALMGMNERVYIGAKYVVFYSFYVVFVILFLLFGYFLFEFRIFTHVNTGLLLLILAGNGLSLITFSFLFSTFFNDAFLALFVSFFASMIPPSFASNLRAQLFTNLQPEILWSLKFLLFLWPFPIVEAVGLMRETLLADLSVPFAFLYEDTHMLIAVLSMFVGAVTMMIAHVFLSNVIPQPHKVRRGPCFVIFAIIRCVCPKSTPAENPLPPDRDELEDRDVRREREACEGLRMDELGEYGVVLRGLSKKYPGASSYSVRGVNLRVRKGECLGLLGKNGAGKTTTIRVITSQVAPTRGTAFVCGMDIRTKAAAIRQRVGVCEQFDALFDELTAEETLLFYSRLRGVPPLEQKQHVREILRDVGLIDEKKEKECGCICQKIFCPKSVKSLDAGARRRLSIAIAIVGNPDVIYLDEPTTGIPEAARQNIWKIVKRLKRKHAVVITTHSMKEAEVLADRIAIMSLGRLKAMGTAQHLKAKFGQRVTLRVKAASVQGQGQGQGQEQGQSKTKEAEVAVERLLWDCRSNLTRDFDETITYDIETDNLVISDLFEGLQKLKEEGTLGEWFFRQNTLEDVFVTLVEKDETGAQAIELRLRRQIMSLQADLSREARRREEEDAGAGDGDGDVGVEDESDSSSAGSEDGLIEGDLRQVPEDPSLSPLAACCGRVKTELLTSMVQLLLLLKKNVLSAKRGCLRFAVQLFFAALLPLLLAILFWLGGLSDTETFFDAVDVQSLPACRSAITGVGCYQFVYATNDHPLAEDVMSRILSNYSAEISSVRRFENGSEMLDWIFEHPNQTLAAIDFEKTETVPPAGKPYIGWTIYVNRTALDGVKGDVDDVAPRLQLLLDNAVLVEKTGNPKARISAKLKSTPLYPLKEKHDVYGTYNRLF